MRNYFTHIFWILFFTVQSCGQNQKEFYTGSYYVNKELLHSIEDRITTIHGVPTGSIDLKVFINDTLVSDTAAYSVSKNGDYRTDSSLEKVINNLIKRSIKNQLNTWTTLDGDTANISCFYGLSEGFGFELALYKDTCIIRHTATSATPIYKLNQNDTWSSEVTVPCKLYKLTLVSKPKFKKYDIIEGVVSLTSDDYYVLSNNIEKKYSVQLTGYFKTVPLQGSKKDYDDSVNKPN